MSKSTHRQRGAAAVEFAILLPVLMVLLLGIMEFGYAFFLQASVSAAAREGVRYYAINWNNSDSSVKAAAPQRAFDLARAAVPIPANVVVASTRVTTPCPAAGGAQFEIVYQYSSLTGLLDSVLGKRITITGKGNMQCAA